MKKILTGALILSPILLTSCWNKNIPAEESVEPSRASTMSQEEANHLLADSDFSLENATLQDLSSHIRSTSGISNIPAYIESLTGTDQNTVIKKAYLQSFVGDYTQANQARDELCSYSNAHCAQKNIEIKVPKAVDKSGAAVAGTQVYIDTKKIQNAPTETRLYDNMVHRIRIAKEGYLDSYGSLNAVEGGYNTLEASGVLKKAEAHTSSPATEAVVKKVTNFEYHVPANAFVDQSGKAVTGDVDVYYFSMDQSDQDLSIFGLSAFGPDGNLIGDSMITYGMPLVTAYQDGNPLRIIRPIEGTGTILGINDTMNLKDVPKNVWLNGAELLEYGIPPFWSLNRETGTWTETRMMILDEQGNYRFEIIR